jgi:hypothetical protein
MCDVERRLKERDGNDLPPRAWSFRMYPFGWFSFQYSMGVMKTTQVPNCSKATAFQKATNVVRVSPAS